MPNPETHAGGDGNTRIQRVFRFLKEYDELRNPAVRRIDDHPWHFWLDDLPDHPSVELRQIGLTKAADDEDGPPPSVLLRVGKPQMTTAPTPPPELDGWLTAGWQDPRNECKVLRSRNTVDRPGETVTVQFEDSPARVEAFALWCRKHADWRDAERPTIEARKVFETLHALRGRMERESDSTDLVIGDGLFSWKLPDNQVYHPLVLRRVRLEFNAELPEFWIVAADENCELCTTLFQGIPEADPDMLAARRLEVEKGACPPLSVELTAYVQGFVNHLSAQGVHLDRERPTPGCAHPTVGRGPVLFLRSRAKNFARAIGQALETVRTREDFSEALLNIVGCETSRPRDQRCDESSDSRFRRECEVLFAKPANAEQYKIAQRLELHSSVLVQGPPGTGKSHTIANLIGHLLADGRSVLVTSHTKKALRVLRERVVEELRPLCVSLVDDGAESREQLKRSVQQIACRLSEADAEDLDRQADLLQAARAELLGQLARGRDELRKARADEYRPIVFGGSSWSPSEAARRVAAGVGRDDWIPGPVALGGPTPLSQSEVDELYSTNGSTSLQDEAAATEPFPSAEILLSPKLFLELIEVKQSDADESLWGDFISLSGKEERLRDLAREFGAAVAEFRGFDVWQVAAVDAGRASGSWRELWQELVQRIQHLQRTTADDRALFIKHRPATAAEPALELQIQTVEDIRRHLQKGARLRERGWWPFNRRIRKEWRSSYVVWSVDGRPPETTDDFLAVERLLAATIERAAAGRVWDRLMASSGLPAFMDLGDEPESGAGQYLNKVRRGLNWWKDRWSPLADKLRALGFDWDRFFDKQPFRREIEIIRNVDAVAEYLIPELGRVVERLARLTADARLRRACDDLAQFNRPEVAQVRESMRRRDRVTYRTAWKKCSEAAVRRQAARRRVELLGLMDRQTDGNVAVAAQWASAIRNRFGVHGESEPPGDVGAAWEWRQLNDELERRSSLDVQKLENDLVGVEIELRQATCELIDKRAWAGQVRRTSLEQRQALMGWLKTIERIGKGTGKLVPALLRKAQELMAQCQTAVPVWIMPLDSVYESYNFSQRRFDVVIIDEASQCDVRSLLSVALADKVVIVGDDEQVSPTAVGEKLEPVEHLRRTHLLDIPNSQLYEGRMSIYDLAKQSFAGSLMLLEHFRSVPDIIAFSNQLCYEGKIKPLREDSDSPLHPHVVPYRVEGFQDEKTKVNHEEALTVASLLCAAIERPEYKGKSFGVISLLGDEQAREVENILQHVPPIEYERRRIICGNAAQFQGDERDVMFLTMVSSPREGPLRMSDDKMTRRRFNVAASRARDQLWLVYSLDPAIDLKEGDLRKRLIDHVVDPRAGSRELERLVSQTQSPFEERVLEHLVRRGYSVTPQWPVGAYRIDFVIEGGGRRMALECDGDRYHSDENIQQDIERQAILERLGWRFIRIRGSVFFRDPERTMQGVIKRLEEAGIPPEGHGAGQDSEDSALVAAIKARASELRTAWAQRSNLSNPSTGSDDGRGSGSHCLARKPVRRWRRPEEKSDSPSPVESNQSLGVLEPTEPSKNLTPRLRSGMTSSSPPELRRGLDSEANRMTATTDFEGLVNEVDRRIFPAVFNTPPAGSRKQRIKKWLSALESCPVTPTAILDALLKADPSLARPIEKTKVVDAIEAWSR